MFVVVVCKVALAFTKAVLFVSFHPSTAAAPTGLAQGAGDCLRWGGAGIQAGSLVGACLFFLLTVVWRVL